MPTVRLSSADVHFRSEGSGLPLLLLHGSGGNSLIWFQQIPAFSRHFACFAVDQPGFGHSYWTTEPVAYSAVLSELADHLGWERFAVVGHSLGGWAALRIALQHPERVAAVVLSSSWAGIQSREVLLHLKEREPRLAELRKAWHEKRPGSYLPALSPTFQTVRPDLYWLAQGISAFNSDGPSMAWDTNHSSIMTPETSLAELGEWSIPTLCLVGSEDVYVPPNAMRAVAKEFRTGALSEIPGAGHWTYLEQAETYNERVVNFLQAQPG